MPIPEPDLVVEVPVLEEAATDDVCGFMTPFHSTHFSRRSLDNILRRSGWHVIEMYQAVDYNGCRALAAPAPTSSAIVGDPWDVSRLYEHLASWYQSLFHLNQRLRRLEPYDRCVIWGAGFHTESLYQRSTLFQQRHDREYVIVDGDPLKHQKSWRGIAIGPPTWLCNGVDWAMTMLVVSSYGSESAIVEAASTLGVPEKRVLRLYESRRVY